MVTWWVKKFGLYRAIASKIEKKKKKRKKKFKLNKYN